MKNIILIFLAVVTIGCNDMQKTAMNVIREPTATDTTVADLPTQETVTYSQYDVNQDGAIDNTDLTLVSVALGQTNPDNPRLDINGNGSIDGQDIILVSQHLGDTGINAKEPTPVVEPEYLELTYENAFDLPPGIYRFRSNGYFSGTDDLGDDVITSLNWGSVLFGEEIEGSPPDAPKLLVYIELNPQPYVKMINGKLAIEYEPVNDELLVEIGEKLREGTEQGGERGNRFTYTYIVYQGVALENLTNPDRAFEYE